MHGDAVAFSGGAYVQHADLHLAGVVSESKMGFWRVSSARSGTLAQSSELP